MAVTVKLTDEAWARFQAEAARRRISIEEVIELHAMEGTVEADSPSTGTGSASAIVRTTAGASEARRDPQDPRHDPEDQSGVKGGGLAISGVGASGGSHGRARDVDAALAEGFGLS